MSNNNNAYEFKVQVEDVSNKDEFVDQTHQKVSNSLKSLIDSSDQAVTIGLEGQWGSGKSTVINLLRKDTPNDVLFFCFDAWAHEGDPLRRIFLESLINFIDPDNKDNDLKKISKEITGKSRKVDVNSSTKTTSFTNILAASSLLVPLGIALISQSNFTELAFFLSDKAGSFDFASSFGLLFVLLPALVTSSYYLFTSEDLNIFKSESTEKYSQAVTEENERSSIEFEKYFKRIITKYIGKDKKYNKTIIVIDNLDRLEEAQAKKALSTLQTFFQHRNNISTKDEWLKDLWFIVPYDKVGISKIWQDESNTSEDTIKDKSAITKSFLDKSFQIIAEVPSPVFSGWNNYLSKKIDLALTGWPKESKLLAIDSFTRYFSHLHTSPNARSINNFINQIGFTALKYRDEMSAEAISIYCLYRKELSDSELREGLIANKLPKNYEPIGDKELIKKEVAGLLFGVSKDKGFELLLKPAITDALKKGDSESVNELILKHDQGFWIVWKAVKNDLLPTVDSTEDYRIQSTTAICKGMASFLSLILSERKQLQTVWETTSDNWKLTEYSYDKVLESLYMIAVNSEASMDWTHKVLTEKLSTFIKTVEADSSPDVPLLKVFEQFSTLLTRLKKPYAKLLYGHLDANNWPAWVEALTSNDIRLPSVLPGKNAITSLGEVHLIGTTLDQNVLDVLLYTNEIYPHSKEWASIVDKLNAWLILQRREANNDLAYLLTLALYSSNEDSRPSIKTSIESASFLSLINSDNPDEVPHLPLLIASALEDELQENATVPAFIKNFWADDKANKETMNFSLVTLQKHELLNTVWSTAKDKRNKFSLMVLETNLENKDLFSCEEGVLDVGEIFLNFDASKVGDIVKKLCSLSGFKSAKETLRAQPLDYDKTLYALQTHGENKAISFVNSILKSLSIKNWEESFKNNNFLLHCTFNKELKLDHKFTKAFINCVSSLIQGEVYFSHADTQEWFWENFKLFVDKIIDKEINKAKLSKLYFEVDKDSLDDAAFEEFSKIITLTLDVQSNLIVKRMCDWIDAGQSSRLEWIAKSGYKLNTSPTDGLISRIHDLHLLESELLTDEIIEKLTNAFNIPAFPDATEDGDNRD